MTIRVRLFALLRDRAGVSALSLELPDAATCADAAEMLAERFPAIAEMLPRAACAVDQSLAPRETMLKDGQELALIPPVSGGSDR